MKIKEELFALKEEVKTMNRKPNELIEEELAQVNGGVYLGPCFVYVIVKGDTLCGIAERFGTTVELLCEVNNIKNQYLIYPGNKLLVPDNR